MGISQSLALSESVILGVLYQRDQYVLQMFKHFLLREKRLLCYKYLLLLCKVLDIDLVTSNIQNSNGNGPCMYTLPQIIIKELALIDGVQHYSCKRMSISNFNLLVAATNIFLCLATQGTRAPPGNECRRLQ